MPAALARSLLRNSASRIFGRIPAGRAGRIYYGTAPWLDLDVPCRADCRYRHRAATVAGSRAGENIFRPASRIQSMADPQDTLAQLSQLDDSDDRNHLPVAWHSGSLSRLSENRPRI